MKNIEWKNGDKCVYSHDKKINYTYIGAHPSRDGHFVFNEWKGITYINNGYLEKLPSKKQARLEAATELYHIHCKNVRHPVKDLMNNSEIMNAWLAIVDKTGYRKGE